MTKKKQKKNSNIEHRLNVPNLIALIQKLTGGDSEGVRIVIRHGYGREIRNRIVRLQGLSSEQLGGAQVRFIPDDFAGRNGWNAALDIEEVEE